ncbi:hypothetical protein BH11PSE6_BH11PSE6_00080 [soil metagenome]
MTAEQFAYWMQGFAELTGDEPPTAAQWKSMREHLATVFVKVTPVFDYTKQPGVPYVGSPFVGPDTVTTGWPPVEPLPRTALWRGPPATVTCTAIAVGSP